MIEAHWGKNVDCHNTWLDDPTRRSFNTMYQGQGQGQGQASPGEAIRGQGNAHYGRGQFEQAIACYTRCLALDGRDVLALSNRAMARLKLGQHEAAREDAAAALAIDPAHVKVPNQQQPAS